MRDSEVVFGDPFYFATLDGNIDHMLEDIYCDNHIGAHLTLAHAVSTSAYHAAEDMDAQVYLCIPVVRVRAGEIPTLPDELEILARAAATLGEPK